MSFELQRQQLLTQNFIVPVRVSGSWYSFDESLATSTGGAGVTTTTYFIPFISKGPANVSMSALGAQVTTPATGGNIALALYASSGSPSAPGSLLANTASISVAATGFVSGTLTGMTTIAPGIYWFGLQFDNTTVVLGAATAAKLLTDIGLPNALISNGALTAVYTQSGTTFGTWPNPTGTLGTGTNSRNYRILFKVT